MVHIGTAAVKLHQEQPAVRAFPPGERSHQALDGRAVRALGVTHRDHFRGEHEHVSSLETGARLVPLSLTLIVAAAGIPKIWAQASPRRVVRIGVFLMLAGLLSLLGGIDLDANAAVVTIPMVLMGLGMGALASQLGSVTVSA